MADFTQLQPNLEFENLPDWVLIPFAAMSRENRDGPR